MSSSARALDRDRLGSFTQGDEQLERELAALFVGAAERYLGEMRCSTDNEPRWRRAAHALKGASANIGAARLAELARGAENEPPCMERLQGLESELETLRDLLGMPLADPPPERRPVSRP